jgi:hypothetical protein
MEDSRIVVTIEPSSRILAPPVESLEVFSLTVPVVVSPGSVSSSTIKDVVFTVNTTATIRNDYQVSAASTPPKPTVCSVSQGNITVSDTCYVTGTGSGTIHVRSGATTKRVNVNVNTIGGQSVSTFDSYVNGSLGKLLNEELDARLPTSIQAFNTKNNTTPSYIRNADCWPGIDKTCWPAWNSSTGNKFNGCLISPRHICYAAHANVPSGATIRFVTNDNQVVERTVGARINIGTFDLRIAVLNADVPESISFAKVLPTDFLDYMTPADLPLLAADQETKLVIREWTQYNGGSYKSVIHRRSEEENRSAFSETIISGDSGSPVFVVINDELVLLGCHYTSIACPLITGYTSEVNAAMTTLGGGYQLTAIDLSEFTNYG